MIETIGLCKEIYPDAIVKGHTADRDGLEETGDLFAVRLWVSCSTGRRILAWSEVRDSGSRRIVENGVRILRHSTEVAVVCERGGRRDGC